jgi:hypothetical protein
MRQTAKLLATVAVLALPGAVFFASSDAALARPPGPQGHAPQGLHRPPHGRDKSHGQDKPGALLLPFEDDGLPVVVPAAGEPDIVTHDFVDPRYFEPRRRFPRSVEILSDVPAFVSEPPHIIELRRHRHRRAPITIVRRGVISQE